MTTNNLTLNNWKEQFNSFYLETIGEDDSTKRWHSKLEKFFSKLLSLQHQKDIEQFKRELDKIKEIADGCIYVGKENVEKLEVIKKVIKGYGNKSTI